MTTTNITLVKQAKTYPLIIPKNTEVKIKNICTQIWNTEWSGILFYTYEGSFKESNLKIICKDVFLMNIGSSAFTEFDVNPEIVEYMTEHPDLLTCQMGLIHSHHGMQSFFSSTDLNTLKIEGSERNHFLSLIVNNQGIYSAAITRKVESIKDIEETVTFKTFEDKTVTTKDNFSIQDPIKVEYFPLTIQFENSFNDSELNERIDALYKQREKTKSFSSALTSKTNSQEKQLSLFKEPSYKTDFKGINQLFPPKESKKKDNNLPDLDTASSFIDSLVLQLITGCVVISNNKIDVVKWANNMTNTFSKRFKTFSEFEDWAEIFIEYLISYTEFEDVKRTYDNDEEIQILLAFELIEKLEKLPSNKYIKTYIEILNRWSY